jgi:GTP-binding protein
MTQEATPHEFVPAQFIKGIIGTDEITDDYSRIHVAFIGRSNVGKSSLMNALLGRVDLVKSSARAGKTTEVNYFSVGDDYYFVDLPGYGFARLGEKQREKLRKLIIWYLLRTEIAKQAVCIVVDAQVGLTEFDEEIREALQAQATPVCVVANKIDRLSQSDRAKLENKLQATNTSYYTASARTSRGVEAIREYILNL